MDEGAPVAYLLVERGVAVLAVDGTAVGSVNHVVAAPDQDIFHGIVIDAYGHGPRFVEAELVAELHENGVDLLIEAAAIVDLPKPGGAAPVYEDDPAGANKWTHLVHRLKGQSDWRRRD